MDMGLTYYATDSGKEPYWDWFDGLERERKAAVIRQISKLARGLGGHNFRHLGEDLWEIKITYKAMRVYYGKAEGILILFGGDKRTQKRDIKRAKLIWRNFHREKQIV